MLWFILDCKFISIWVSIPWTSTPMVMVPPPCGVEVVVIHGYTSVGGGSIVVEEVVAVAVAVAVVVVAVAVAVAVAVGVVAVVVVVVAAVSNSNDSAMPWKRGHTMGRARNVQRPHTPIYT